MGRYKIECCGLWNKKKNKIHKLQESIKGEICEDMIKI